MSCWGNRDSVCLQTTIIIIYNIAHLLSTGELTTYSKSTMKSKCVLFLVGLCALLQLSDSLPLTTNARDKVKRAAGRHHLVRKARAAGLIGKTYDFSFCSQDIQLSLGRKRLNRQNFRLSVPEAVSIRFYDDSVHYNLQWFIDWCVRSRPTLLAPRDLICRLGMGDVSF